jgi:hypothetical protein
VHLDFGRGLDLILGHRDLEVIGTDLNPAERHKSQVAVDKAFLDSGELRLVGLDVNVNVLQLSDLVAVAIQDHLAVPVGDIPPGLA